METIILHIDLRVRVWVYKIHILGKKRYDKGLNEYSTKAESARFRAGFTLIAKKRKAYSLLFKKFQERFIFLLAGIHPLEFELIYMFL